MNENKMFKKAFDIADPSSLEAKVVSEDKFEYGDEPEYTPWDKFDPLEYTKRNYENMLPEDKIIIKSVIQAMKKYGIKEGQFENVADIGAGPNLYPSMLLAPYVKDKGKISLIEYAVSNREYLEKILGDDPQGEYLEHQQNWIKYGETIESMSDAKYEGIFEEVKNKVEIKAGSIYDLPREEYSAVSSFFCAESITDKPEEFKKALDSLIDSLKPGGIFIVAHMVGSEGYYAGEGTKFPAINLTEEDLNRSYGSMESIADFHLERAEAGEGEKKAREGYHGMAVVIGRKKTAEEMTEN